jgi:hypothetical protein
MTTHPQAGDGIVVIATGKKHVVRGRLFKGFVRGTPTDDDMDIIGVFIVEDGEEVNLLNGSYRRQYWYEIIRPTGFGRTSWPMFGMIQAACAALLIAGIPTWSDGGWVAVAMVAAIETVLVWQSHRNYTGKTR